MTNLARSSSCRDQIIRAAGKTRKWWLGAHPCIAVIHRSCSAHTPAKGWYGQGIYLCVAAGFCPVRQQAPAGQHVCSHQGFGAATPALGPVIASLTSDFERPGIEAMVCGSFVGGRDATCQQGHGSMPHEAPHLRAWSVPVIRRGRWRSMLPNPPKDRGLCDALASPICTTTVCSGSVSACAAAAGRAAARQWHHRHQRINCALAAQAHGPTQAEF